MYNSKKNKKKQNYLYIINQTKFKLHETFTMVQIFLYIHNRKTGIKKSTHYIKTFTILHLFFFEKYIFLFFLYKLI